MDSNQNKNRIAMLLSAKDIFLEAIEVPVDQQSALVRERCAGNAKLQSQVEELLLRHCQKAESILSVDFGKIVATELRTGTIRATDDSATDDVTGRYELLEELGRGGFAAVFKGRQTSPVERDVAIKLLHSHTGAVSDKLLTRFRAEREMQSLMDHPNIARLLDAGETAQGQPFLVMEYVNGSHITDYCDANNSDIDERLQVFVDVCHGVQHAHQKGVIHRDLKPSNILVSPIDGQPVPKVIDFGVAKVFEGESHRVDLTERGQLVGSPAYMSPEQARSELHNIDTRTDVYSLGVLLYELLTGRLPFGPRDLESINSAEMVRLICDTDPRPLSQCHSTSGHETIEAATNRNTTPRKLRGHLSSDLNWIVMKCLERDPARRYGSVNELMDDVQRHLDVQPVVAGPPTWTYRLSRFVKRNKVGVLATSIVVATLLLGIVGTTAGMLMAFNERDRAVAAEDVAVEQKTKANEAKYLAQQIETLHGDLLEDCLTEDYSGKLRPVLLNSLNKAVRRIDEQGADQELISAELRYTIGVAYLNMSNFHSGEQQLKLSLATFQKLLGPDHPKCCYAQIMLATCQRHTGDTPKANEKLLQAVAGCRDVSPADVIQWGTAMRMAAKTYHELDDFVAQEDLTRHTLKTISTRLPKDHNLVFAVTYDLAYVLTRQQKHDVAAEVCQKLLQAQTKTLGLRHPQTRNTMGMLSACYRNTHQRDKGLAISREVCEIDRSLGNPNFRRLATLGQLQCLTGDYYHGLPNLETALELAAPDRKAFLRGKVRRFETAAEEAEGIVPLTAGIGVKLSLENGRIVVQSIEPGGSAEHSQKIEVGDVIRKVVDSGREFETKGKSADQVESFIQGLVGTDVSLDIERAQHLVRLTRTPLPQTEFEFPQESVGTQPSEVRFTKLESRNAVRLSEFRGKLTVVYLWASWCGASQRPIEKLHDFTTDHPEWNDRVQIIGASLDESVATAETHTKRKDWQRLLHVHLDKENAERLGAVAVPQLIVVDASGEIRYSGDVHDIELESLIPQLLVESR